MKRKIVKTADGSTTIHLEEWNEQYHSKHGAVQEAYHVFIKHGLDQFSESVDILEIGFGTGLNAFITLLESEKRLLKVKYHGVEAYPVSLEEIEALNYTELLSIPPALDAWFVEMHKTKWDINTEITPRFELCKRRQFFSDITDKNVFDLIYFDAFGTRVQPELWTESIFKKMYTALKSPGILVTYAAKGSVRRAMQSVGFKVERLPGPPGKREMLRAIK